jgi:hypothetical protein
MTEGSQEQPLKDKRVVDVRRGGQAGRRYPLSVSANMVRGAWLAAMVGVGPVRSPPRLADQAAVAKQIGMAAPHADPRSMRFGQQARPAPAGQTPAQARATGWIRGGTRTAPGRALVRKAPRGRHNPDGRGRGVAGAMARLLITGGDDRGDNRREPKIQCCRLLVRHLRPGTAPPKTAVQRRSTLCHSDNRL